MDQRIVAVYDAKVGAYAQPWFVPTPGAAIRAFGDVVADKSSDIAKHPEDYSLFELGTWIPDKGRFEPFVAPVQIATALQFVER